MRTVRSGAGLSRLQPCTIRLLRNSRAVAGMRLLSTSSGASFDPMEGNVHWKVYESKALGRRFRIAEARNIDPVFDHSIENNLPEPFGIMTWESSYLMAQILEQHYSHGELHSQVVCDLGCGTGLTSLLCAHLGAKQVLALDYNEYSLQLTKASYDRFKHSKATDFIPSTTSTVCLPTEHVSEVLFQSFDMTKYEQVLPRCDLLLLSDVMYTP